MSDLIYEGIDQARTRGIEDAKILDSIAKGEQAEVYGEGIEKARKQGVPDAKIVDSIKQGRVDFQESNRQGQSWGEWAGDIGKAVIRGAGSQVSNLGSTLQIAADAPGSEQAGTQAKVSDALMAQGDALQKMAPASDTGGAQWLAPSTWPKALAEAAPGILGYLAAARAGAAVGGAAGVLGGPLAEVTVPAGALIGGLGGMGMYAYGQNRGVNATAHANEGGRNFPEQKDFDQTLAPTIAQSGIDAALQGAGGLVGKVAGNSLGAGADKLIKGVVGDGIPGKVATTVLNGPNPITGVGVKGLVNTATRVGTTDAALAAQGAADSAIQDYAATKDSVGGPFISTDKALTAAKEGAILGTALRGGRTIGSIHASAKFGGGDVVALDRVADHLKSEAFPMDPTDPKKTAETLSLARDLYKDRVNKLKDIKREEIDATNPDALSKQVSGLNGHQQEAVDTTLLFLKKGKALKPEQIETLRKTLGEDREGEPKGARTNLIEAIRDLNVVNFMTEKAGVTEQVNKVGLGSVLKAAKSPFAIGSLGHLAAEGAIHGSLSLGALAPATGVGAAAYIAAKGLGSLTGISANNQRPLARMMDRFGTRGGQEQTAPTPIADRYKAMALAQQAMEAARASQGAPEAAQGVRPPPHPEAPPVAPEAPTGLPGVSDHGSLAAALGVEGFSPSSLGIQRSPRPERSGPVEAPQVPVADIHTEIAAQARAEGQPVLDVYGQHLRSAHSIKNNPNVPESVRARATMEAVELKSAMDRLGAEADPEAFQRSRSPKLIDEAPAPGFEPIIDVAGLSPAGQTYARGASPGVRQQIAASQTPAGVEQALGGFLSGFKNPQDRATAASRIEKSGVMAAGQARTKAALNKKVKVAGRKRGRPKKAA